MKIQRLFYPLFIARCAGSATLGFVVAGALGLPYPLWASISAVVVSQNKLEETKLSILWRTAGTILGACVAVGLYALARPFDLSTAVLIAISVAIGAAFAYRQPGFRPAMFTSPIIFLTASASEPFYMVGLYRSSEVILGGLLAGAVHIGVDKLLTLIAKIEDRRGGFGLAARGGE